MSRKIRELPVLVSGILAAVLLFGSVHSLSANPVAAQGQASKWSQPLNISKTTSKSWLPSACADRQGNVHVVWAEFDSDSSSTSDTVYYAWWNGRQWSKPAAILVSGAGPASGAQNAAWHPVCAADDYGRLHVVWTDTHSIFYSQGQIGTEITDARGWSPRRMLYPNPGAPAGFPAIAVDGPQTVYVAFNIYSQTLFLSSSDGGRNWSQPVSVADTPNRATRPRIFVAGQGVIHIGMMEVNDSDNGIGALYARSTDGGRTWYTSRELSGGTDGRYPGSLNLAMDGQGILHAVWPAVQDFVFFDRSSKTKGSTWSDAVTIARGKVGYGSPSMGLDVDGNLHLLLTIAGDIVHYQWDGTKWVRLENVSQTKSSSEMPTLLVTNGNLLHAIWMEYAQGTDDVHGSGNFEIYYSAAMLPMTAKPITTFLPQVPTATLAPTTTPTRIIYPTPTVTAGGNSAFQDPVPDLQNRQVIPLIAGVVPIMLLLALVVVGHAWKRD